MNIEIREAEKTDAQAIASLSGQFGYISKTEEITDRLNAILILANHCVFVAEINKMVVGWIHATHCLRVESSPFVEVMGLVVDQNERNKGIGKRLIAEVAEWSRRFDCEKLRVRCNTVRKESHIFYEKIGFAEIKEQKIFERNLYN